MAQTVKTPKALVDFVKDRRRAACVVCSLPDDVRVQVRTAREKKIDRRTVIEWLHAEVDSKIGETDLAAHTNGHHE